MRSSKRRTGAGRHEDDVAMNPDFEEAGSLISAGLAASEIDRASWSPNNQAHAGQSCGNCGTQLTGAYCHGCGQAAHLHRSLLHLLEEVLHSVLHFDAKGWRTLPLLVARPGLLTRRYIDGQRTRYVSPLALFLFTVFLMFFVYAMTSGTMVSTPLTASERAQAAAELAQERQAANAQVARATAALAQARRTGEDVADARTDLAAANAELQIMDKSSHAITTIAAGNSAVAAVGPWQQQLAQISPHTGFPRLDSTLHQQLQNPELFLYKLKNTAYKFSFMLIPISLPFLWLLFMGRPAIAMYDHAVFSLYSLSFMSLLFIAAALLGVLGAGALATSVIILVPPVHMFVQLRGTYGLGIFAAAWRTFALLCVAGTAFCLFLVFIVMINLH
jgi:hypothetical protein